MLEGIKKKKKQQTPCLLYLGGEAQITILYN